MFRWPSLEKVGVVTPTTTVSQRVNLDWPVPNDGGFPILRYEIQWRETPDPLFLPEPSAQTVNTGEVVSILLPAATGGAGSLTYSVTGLPSGYSFSPTTRQIVGSSSVATSVTLTYQVVDEDGATRTRNFSFTVQANPAAITDTQITSTPIALSNTYGFGETIEFTVTYDIEVDVTGDPRFPMNLDVPTTAPEFADYAGGTGTREIVFNWIVAATDIDANGIFFFGNSDSQNRGDINLNGGTIRNAGTTINADLTTLNRGTKSGHQVDGTLTPILVDADVTLTGNLSGSILGAVTLGSAPITAAAITNSQITSTPIALSNTYGFAEVIEFTVTYDTEVDVVGIPQFPMNIGQSPSGGPEYADYIGGTGTREIVFGWVVAATDLDTNGIFFYGPNDVQNRGDINLNGGTIRNAGTSVDADLSTLNRGTKSGHQVDGSLDSNTAPVITIATLDQIVNGRQLINIIASAMDPDGTIASLAWTGSGTFGSPTQGNTTWMAPAAQVAEQTYALTLTGTDNDGAMATDSISITVRANQAPEITAIQATPDNIAGGGTINLSAAVTDPENDQLTYLWEANPDVGTFGNINNRDTTWIAPPGTFDDQIVVLTLTANDPLNASDVATVTVTIRAILVAIDSDVTLTGGLAGSIRGFISFDLLYSTAVLVGGLAGSIEGDNSLGGLPNLNLIATLDAGLTGQIRGANSFSDAPALTVTGALNAGLTGQIVGRISLGQAPALEATAALTAGLTGQIGGANTLGTPPPLPAVSADLTAGLVGSIRGVPALGDPLLEFDQFNQDDVLVDFLALFERGSTTSWFQQPPRGTNGVFLEGDLGLGPDETAVTQLLYAGGTLGIYVNDNDVNGNPAPLNLTNYFAVGNPGRDATVYLQTVDGLTSFSVDEAFITANVQGLFLVSPAAAVTLFNGVEAGDRFILGLGQPAHVDAQVSLAAGLTGQISAQSSLGSAPNLTLTATLDAGLTGQIQGTATLGTSPPLDTTATLDTGLTGQIRGITSLGQAPALLDSVTLAAGLVGQLTALASVSSVPHLNNTASLTGGLVGNIVATAVLTFPDPLDTTATLDTGLTGQIRGIVGLDQAPALNNSATLTAGLVGQLVASASVGTIPILETSASLAAGLVGQISATASVISPNPIETTASLDAGLTGQISAVAVAGSLPRLDNTSTLTAGLTGQIRAVPSLNNAPDLLLIADLTASLTGSIVGQNSLGNLPFLLSNFNDVGLSTIFVGLLEAGNNPSGDFQVLWARPPSANPTGQLLDGFLTLAGTIVNRLSVELTAGQIRFDEDDTPTALDIGAYFAPGGAGHEQTLYFQTEDQLVSFPVATTYNAQRSTSSAVFFDHPVATNFLHGVRTGQRFLVGLGQQQIEAIEVTFPSTLATVTVALRTVLPPPPIITEPYVPVVPIRQQRSDNQRLPDYRYDLTKLFTQDLLSKDQWRNLAEVASRVFFQYVYNDIQGFLESDDPDYLQQRSPIQPIDYTVDNNGRQVNQIELREANQPVNRSRELLTLTAKNLGFNYFSDTFTDIDYQRLIQFWGLFLNEKAPDSFINFIGFIKNTEISATLLWTNRDYQDFVSIDQIPAFNVVTGTGGTILDPKEDHTDSYFPTPHVEVRYNPTNYNFTFAELQELFRQIAPTHVVLERIVAGQRLISGIQLNFAIEKINTTIHRTFPAITI